MELLENEWDVAVFVVVALTGKVPRKFAKNHTGVKLHVCFNTLLVGPKGGVAARLGRAMSG